MKGEKGSWAQAGCEPEESVRELPACRTAHEVRTLSRPYESKEGKGREGREGREGGGR